MNLSSDYREPIVNLPRTYHELIMNLSWTYHELIMDLPWTYHELIMTWWLTKAEKQLWPNHSITSFVNIPIVNILLLVKLRQSLMFFHGFCSYVFEQRNGGWWFFFPTVSGFRKWRTTYDSFRMGIAYDICSLVQNV